MGGTDRAGVRPLGRDAQRRRGGGTSRTLATIDRGQERDERAGDFARPHERVEVIALAGHEHALRQQAMVLEGRLVGDEEVVPAVIDQRRPVVGQQRRPERPLVGVVEVPRGTRPP